MCFSEDEQRQAMALRGEGLTIRAIARELGRSPTGVWYAIRRARSHPRRPAP